MSVSERAWPSGQAFEQEQVPVNVGRVNEDLDKLVPGVVGRRNWKVEIFSGGTVRLEIDSTAQGGNVSGILSYREGQAELISVTRQGPSLSDGHYPLRAVFESHNPSMGGVLSRVRSRDATYYVLRVDCEPGGGYEAELFYDAKGNLTTAGLVSAGRDYVKLSSDQMLARLEKNHKDLRLTRTLEKIDPRATLKAFARPIGERVDVVNEWGKVVPVERG